MTESVPRLLIQMTKELREYNPKKHPVNYKIDAWTNQFPEDHDLLEINKQFRGLLTREDIITLGKDAITDSTNIRRFTMAVMMWGYGTVGYGADRTRKMLAHPEAVERLASGANIVRGGDLIDACLFFRIHNRGKVEKFDWSFFTKYFYFVGASNNQNPLPLILDGVNREMGVAGGMKKLADDGDKQAVQAMELWWKSTDKKCAEGYKLYVDVVNNWAINLGCRPDAIEVALWRGFSG